MDAICVLLIAAVVGFVVFAAWVGNEAKKPDETVVQLSPARVADMVEDTVGGVLWRRVDGDGDLNFKRRSVKNDGPTVSVGIEDMGDGRTRVMVAMTRWNQLYGFIVNFGSAAWSLKRKIIKKVDSAAGV